MVDKCVKNKRALFHQLRRVALSGHCVVDFLGNEGFQNAECLE